MPGTEKSPLRSAFETAIKPVTATRAYLKKHLGYEVAKRGWDDNSPMTEYPKLKAIKAVFRKHAKNGPLMAFSPVHIADLVRDLAVVASPNHNKALLPKFVHNDTLDDDLLLFKPNPARKARLMASTSHETNAALCAPLPLLWVCIGQRLVSKR